MYVYQMATPRYQEAKRFQMAAIAPQARCPLAWHLVLVGNKLGRLGQLERDGQPANGVVVGTALKPGEDSLVDCRLQSGATAAQDLDAEDGARGEGGRKELVRSIAETKSFTNRKPGPLCYLSRSPRPLPVEDHPSPGTPERLVRGGRDDVRVGEGRGDHAGGYEARDVSHVGHEVGAHAGRQRRRLRAIGARGAQNILAPSYLPGAQLVT